MGILESIKNHNRRLAEALNESSPVEKKKKKKKKKVRTHVNEFSASELEAMSVSDFLKLSQD